MARHYYTIEIVVEDTLDEDDVYTVEEQLENILRAQGSALIRISTEYIDSEG